MSKPTKRQIAGYLARKAPEEVTLADVRRWIGAPRFNAEGPDGTGHGVSVPKDDWQRYVAHFKRHHGMDEADAFELAQSAWERATARMEWGPIFELMKEEAKLRRRSQ